VYKDQLKLKKAEEAKQEILKNNGMDMRVSENKMSHECETFGGREFCPLVISLKISKKNKIEHREV